MIASVITMICLVSCMYFNARMDVSAIDGFENPWWNKSQSWENKWKNGDPEQGERFFLSSTVLVFLTDGWHLSQFLFHSSWQLIVAVWTPWPIISFIVIKTLFSAGFEFFYRKMKK